VVFLDRNGAKADVKRVGAVAVAGKRVTPAVLGSGALDRISLTRSAIGSVFLTGAVTTAKTLPSSVSPPRVGLAGAGNVGSALLFELARSSRGLDITIAATDAADAHAARLDAISGFPQSASRIRPATALEGSFDVVVVTAGLQPSADTSQEDLPAHNVDVARAALSAATNTTWVVVVGTPVDEVTQALAERPPVAGQYVGFGSDLDQCRLRAAWTLAASRTRLGSSVSTVRAPYRSTGARNSGKPSRGRGPAFSQDDRESEGQTSEPRVGPSSGKTDQLRSGGGGRASRRTMAEEYGYYMTWPHRFAGRSLVRLPVDDIGPLAQGELSQLAASRTH
jgi:hypothetical protein